jgi:hypothetical protein
VYSFVDSHFSQFFQELEFTLADKQIADARALRIAKSLSAKYYPNREFNQNCCVKVGSYGKGLATRPRTDLDMFFVLPSEVYTRFESLSGNKQSALLQEVKRTLLGTFPTTELSADGQVVVAPFQTYNVDVVPAFRIPYQASSYLIANTANGGSWRISDPFAEYRCLRETDAISGGKASDLVKMLKAWKRECNAAIKSICLECAATVFISQWEFREKGNRYSYHDYMVRDFFAFLLEYPNGHAKPAGSQDWIPMGDCWVSRCQSAHDRAVKACNFEYTDDAVSASNEWQKIFGSQFQTDWANSSLARALAGLTV